MRRCVSAAGVPKLGWPAGWRQSGMSQPTRRRRGWEGEGVERPRAGCHRVAPPWRAAKEVSSAAYRAAPLPPSSTREGCTPCCQRLGAAMPASMPPPPRRRTLAGRSGWRGLSGLAGIGLGAAVLVVGWLATPALAQTVDPTLGQVIDRLRNVLVGLLVGLATLFLTVGGVRYLFAGGDPGQVEKAKVTLRSPAIGYGLAALAPVLVRLLRYVVGS